MIAKESVRITTTKTGEYFFVLATECVKFPMGVYQYFYAHKNNEIACG